MATGMSLLAFLIGPTEYFIEIRCLLRRALVLQCIHAFDAPSGNSANVRSDRACYSLACCTRQNRTTALLWLQ